MWEVHPAERSRAMPEPYVRAAKGGVHRLETVSG